MDNNNCCINFVVCEKLCILQFSLSLIHPVGMYEISSLAESEILRIHHSFSKAQNFSGQECGLCLLFLCAVWKSHKNPVKLRFICASSCTSLTNVSKWLSSFHKALLPVVNDLWVSKLRKACVPSVSSWTLISEVDMIQLLSCLRSDVDKASPLLLLSTFQLYMLRSTY
jgi:hypothetical protein